MMVSPARQILWTSAFGKGKTRGILEAADFDCWTAPDNWVIVGRKTLASCWGTIIPQFLEEVIDPELRDWGWRPGDKFGPTLHYPNRSKLTFLGLEDTGRVRTGQYGSGYIEQAEEVTEEMAMSLMGRLRLKAARRRRLGMVCNPEGTGHWLFKAFRPDLVPTTPGNRLIPSPKDIELPDGSIVPAGLPYRECVISDPLDNWENLPLEYQVDLSMMRGRYRDRYWLGRWVNFEGLVYDCFDPSVHVREKPAAWKRWGGYPPPNWERYRAVDFGFENPFAFGWYARVPNTKRLVLYREIYKTKTLVDDHATRIHELEHREREALRLAVVNNSDSVEQVREWMKFLDPLEWIHTIADHDAEDRQTLHRRGIQTEPAQKDVASGIQAVYQQFQLDTSGRPMLSYIRDCVDEVDEHLLDEQKPTCTAEEVGGYKWKVAREGQNAREEPIKLDDHGVDRDRMLVKTLKMLHEL